MERNVALYLVVVHTVATCQLSIIWNLIQEHSECSYKFASAEKRALNPRKRRAEGGGGGGGDAGFKGGGGRVLRISSDRDDKRIF